VLDRLRAEGVDLALQLHGGGRESNPVVRALGAGLTVGARTDDAAPLDRSVRYERWQHEVVRLLTLVELAGAPPVGLQPRLAVTHADQDAAASFVPYRSPVVVLHPGASDRRRRWPVERFAAVGDELARRGASVVVTGSDAESDLAAEVTARMSGPARSVAGRLSLPALVGLLDAAELVVANDTGPRHLAEAIGTPSASVYLASNLITAAPIDRDRHRVQVSWRTSCPLCDERECGHREPWVTDVEVADVLADALALLDLRR
jgi:ADP-heptose:LPS heptosyltransferase